MDEQEAEVGCYNHHREQIHSYEYDLVWSCMVAEALKWFVCTHDKYHWYSLWQLEGGFDYWGISYLMIAPADRQHILPYLGYGKSMGEEAPSHWDWCTGRRHFVKAPGKGQICDFPERLGVVERPSYKGPTCCMHWALGALGGLGYLLEQHTTTGRLTLSWWCAMYKMTCSTFPCDTPWWLWNRMISSPVGLDDVFSMAIVEQDDSLSCG